MANRAGTGDGEQTVRARRRQSKQLPKQRRNAGVLRFAQDDDEKRAGASATAGANATATTGVLRFAQDDDEKRTTATRRQHNRQRQRQIQLPTAATIKRQPRRQVQRRRCPASTTATVSRKYDGNRGDNKMATRWQVQRRRCPQVQRRRYPASTTATAAASTTATVARKHNGNGGRTYNGYGYRRPRDSECLDRSKCMWAALRPSS